MPLYEYYCQKCGSRFELLRPLSRITEPASCPEGHPGGERVLSRFAALSKASDGGLENALSVPSDPDDRAGIERLIEGCKELSEQAGHRCP